MKILTNVGTYWRLFVFAMLALCLFGCGGANEKDPDKPVLLSVSSFSADSANIEWKITETDPKLLPNITYVIHVSTDSGFIPKAATERTSALNKNSASVTGLQADTRYFIKVVARSPVGKFSWSNELELMTPSLQMQRNLAIEHFELNPVLFANFVTDDSTVSFDAPTGYILPKVGSIISSQVGDGFLRRVESVSQDNGVVTIRTSNASLSQVFTQLGANISFKMEQVSEGGAGLTAAVFAAQPITNSASSLDGQINAVGKLIMRGPQFATVAPGATAAGKRLELNVSVEIQNDTADEYQITSMRLVKIDSPFGKTEPTNYTLHSDFPNNSENRQLRRLYWVPTEDQVDDEGQPYKAIFVAEAQRRNCQQTVTNWCDRHAAELVVPIFVTWGALPERAKTRFATSSSASVHGSADLTMDFAPEVNVGFQISQSSLDYANIGIHGPVVFNLNTLITAMSAASAEGTQDRLLTRRFARVFMAGPVPVVMIGRFKLDAKITAQAYANLNINQNIELVYQLNHGVSYNRMTGWSRSSSVDSKYYYALHGEADVGATLDVRLIPDLEISFYEVATAELIVEPYIFGEMNIEGRFSFDKSTGELPGKDSAYRFTKLDLGVGIDASLSATLGVLDINIAHHEWEGELLAPTLVYGLPRIKLIKLEGEHPDLPAAVKVVTEITNVSSLNTFVESSGLYELISGPEDTQLFNMESDEKNSIWVLPGQESEEPAKVRFYGHGSLGPAVLQYEETEIKPECPSEQNLIAGRYKIRGEQCDLVLDTVTGTEWKRCYEGMFWNNDLKACEGSPSSMSWSQMVNQIDHDGWRLPTFAELRSIVYCSSGVATVYTYTVDSRGYMVRHRRDVPVDIGVPDQPELGADIMCAGVNQIPLVVQEAFPNTPSVTSQVYTHYYTWSSSTWGVMPTGATSVKLANFYDTKAHGTGWAGNLGICPTCNGETPGMARLARTPQ